MIKLIGTRIKILDGKKTKKPKSSYVRKRIKISKYLEDVVLGCVFLKGKIWKAYQEVQASNMSKSCVSIKEAEETVKVRSEEKGHSCHYEKVGDRYVVYRSSDRKVMKSINYFAPNLKQFFTDEELRQTTRS